MLHVPRSEREDVLRIRCRPETRKRFKYLCYKYGFDCYEDFLVWLLDRLEQEWRPARLY